MKFKMYYQGGVYELDKEKGKGKIYKIINESTPKHVDKLFSEKSFVDAPSGTYYFYINNYGLQLNWTLDGIYNFLQLIEDTLYDNVNLMQTVNDEGFYYYVVTMPVEDNCIRFVILDRKEEDCRDWQTRYKDPELNSTIAVVDIIISRDAFIQQCHDELSRIYEENKYYISEEYEKECEKEGAMLCQEYALQNINETAINLKYYLRGDK